MDLEREYFGPDLDYKSFYALPADRFQIENLKLRSNLVAGDHTGLRIYSGAYVAIRMLAKFSDLLVRDKTVCELGSGVGTFGLIGSYNTNIKQMVLTDGNEDLFEVLEKNIYHVYKDKPHRRECTFSCRLQWGNEEDIQEIRRSYLKNKENFDVVIGCELMYYNTDVEELLRTVLQLTGDDGIFIHSHLFRTYGQESAVNVFFSRHNWVSYEIPHPSFIDVEELDCHPEWWRIRTILSGPQAKITYIVQNMESKYNTKLLLFQAEPPDMDTANSNNNDHTLFCSMFDQS